MSIIYTQRPVNEITWENRKEIAKIKVGDRVWVSESNDHPCKYIKTVTRLTDTLIIVDKSKERWGRFRRDTGYEMGRGMFQYRITGVATPEEIRVYEAEQRERDKERDRHKKAGEEREAKRIELNALFGDNVYLRSNEFGDGQLWELTFGSLTEENVRELAEALKDAALAKR